MIPHSFSRGYNKTKPADTSTVTLQTCFPTTPGPRHTSPAQPALSHQAGAGTYKIPSVADIPLDLRVHLLRDAPCAETPLAHSSKAVGEPPLFLGASAFFALKVSATPAAPCWMGLRCRICLVVLS